jgi:hypothetical protein
MAPEAAYGRPCVRVSEAALAPSPSDIASAKARRA